MPSFDLLIEKERAERKLEEAEDNNDIDGFNYWYSELKRINDVMQSFPLG